MTIELQTARKEIEAVGGTTITPRTAIPGMGAFAYFKDPEGNVLGLWRVPIFWTPYFLTLFYLGFAISVTPIYLVTWRLVRRFGWRGLAVFIVIVAIIGPPRDYLFAATFPAWMVFAPGVAPMLADAVTYIGIVALGHAVMRLTAGPAREDLLRNES